MKSLGPCNLTSLGAIQSPDRLGRHQSFARLFSLVSLLLLTSPTSFASNLFLNSGETGSLVPKPYMGGHGFRYEFAEQTGMFIIEDLDGAGNIQTRATLDFDGIVLGEPSWIIEIGTSSGLLNMNEAFGDLVLPPGVGSDGTVESSHVHGPDASGWRFDDFDIIYSDGSWWLVTSEGSFHVNLAPPFPTDPSSLASFTNQTGGLVDIHSLIPEPSTLILSLLASAVLLACDRKRAIRKIF